MRFILLVFTLVLSGCAATAKKIMAPSGKEGYLIQNCSVEGCYEKAAEVCPKGYHLHNDSKEIGSVNGQAYSSTSLLIECKK